MPFSLPVLLRTEYHSSTTLPPDQLDRILLLAKVLPAQDPFHTTDDDLKSIPFFLCDDCYTVFEKRSSFVFVFYLSSGYIFSPLLVYSGLTSMRSQYM